VVTAPIGIIGAGLVGLATARQLARAGVPVLVWEKEAAVARHQSGHNSGVVHAGIYYLPGSAKATMTRRGADVTAAGGQVLTGTAVTAVRRDGDGVRVGTAGGTHAVRRLVICADLQADLLARAAGDAAAPEIVSFRGEYLRLRPGVRDRVRHLIYPVPDPAYPFLGVHLTPRIDGEADIGPNAVLALAREGYRWRDVSAAQLARLARSAAFRALARQNWRAGLREMRGSLSRRAFLAEARSYLPWLEPGHVVPAPAGVRAQAVDPGRALVDDFRIHRIGPVTAIRNAPSPAATASLAIAKQIVAELSLSTSTGR